MVDIDAAIGFVVARGDPVERARLSWLRTGAAPRPDLLAGAERGQAPEGGWPAVWGQAPSIDATCFHLAELDDLGALGRPAARTALEWLAGRQRPDGTWEEDEALASEAPAWARPGDPEARLFLTANAAFWLTVAGEIPPAPSPTASPAPVGSPSSGSSPVPAASCGPAALSVSQFVAPGELPGGVYTDAVTAAGQVIADALLPDGRWPSFLVTGWLGASVLYRLGMFYESARMRLVLADRLAGMSPADLAWMTACLRRIGVPDADELPVAARRRLSQTQRNDGGWYSDDGRAFDVHVTLTAIRACRPRT